MKKVFKHLTNCPPQAREVQPGESHTTPEPTIKFVRVERDCDHNKALRNDNESRGILYDFKVLIDGEHRATMDKCGHKPGYYVRDADRNTISTPDSYRKVYGSQVEVADKQANFEAIIIRLLAEGYIPTLDQMAATRAHKAQKQALADAKEAEERRIYRIQRAGVELYAALKHTLDELNRINASYNCVRPDVTYAAAAAIASAEGEQP